MRTLSLALFALAAPLALPGGARAGTCDVPLAAARKLASMPYKLHMVTLAGPAGTASDSEPEIADMIATGDKLYFEIDGDWQVVPADMSGVGALGDDLEADGATCRQLADADLDGTPTTVWSIDDTSQPDVTSQTVWIARDRGLMVRAQQELDDGGGDAGKSQVTMDFSFDGVTAPKGAD